jgi:hypothetical protein
MTIRLMALAIVSLFALDSHAQTTPQKAAAVTPVGIWRGTSTCLVHPSPCHDEVVVYRITQMNTADSVTVDASKIVNGDEQDMGTLACSSTSLNGQVICAIPHGIWRFRISKDSLVGELRLPDNRKFRDVRAIRAH